jgi:hypothetical protein
VGTSKHDRVHSLAILHSGPLPGPADRGQQAVGRSTLDANPLKARLPGKGESQPAVGEGGCPFEPGRFRDDLVLRAPRESANSLPLVARGDPQRRVAALLPFEPGIIAASVAYRSDLPCMEVVR